MHSRTGIIHLDVKSMNLLLTRNGEVKITDFGLSRVKASVRRSGVERGGGGVDLPIGSLPWMAPELVNDDAPSLASDVYSFSVSQASREAAAGWRRS